MILPTSSKPGALVHPAFTFIDLFAGIGGMRLAFEQAGGNCIFTSEWNKFSQQTYKANFNCRYHAVSGDVTQIPADAIPYHDLLVAGFPCQPFSLIGLGAKNRLGQKHGFKDKIQGTLFFDIARVIEHHRPKAFVLENVKNLLHHDKGQTFETIIKTLKDELGYHVQWRVLNAKGIVPQSRNRIFIVGFHDKNDFDFSGFEIQYPPKLPTLANILEPDRVVGDLYTLSDKMMAFVERQAKRNKERGNGFKTRYLDKNDTIPAIVASYGSDREFFVAQDGKNPRRLSPRECARAMGFTDSFIIPVSKTQAYRQFGNSVAVPLVAQIAQYIQPFIVERKVETEYIKPHAYPSYNKMFPAYALSDSHRDSAGSSIDTGV